MLPAAPSHGVAFTHQKAVARVHRGVRRNLGGAVDVPQGQGFAPVQDIKHHPSIPAGRVHGPQESEIRRKLHQAVSVSRGQADVGDRLVGVIGGIDSEVDSAVQLLVGAHVAEGPASGESLPGSNLHLRNRHTTLHFLNAADAAKKSRTSALPCGLFGSAVELPTQRAEELPHFVGQKLRLLQGGEVTSPGHLLPAPDVIRTLGPFPGRTGDFLGEQGPYPPEPPQFHPAPSSRDGSGFSLYMRTEEPMVPVTQ